MGKPSEEALGLSSGIESKQDFLLSAWPVRIIVTNVLPRALTMMKSTFALLKFEIKVRPHQYEPPSSDMSRHDAAFLEPIPSHGVASESHLAKPSLLH